jgi:stalled ribosome rescue protein Dom34
MSQHVVVWLDHHQAKIFHVLAKGFDETSLEAPHAELAKKHNEKHHDKSHPAHQKHFFDDVVRAWGDAREVLVMGPGRAKLELVKHVHAHHASRVDAIVGVESADHPSDRQIVARAREYFLAVDSLRGEGHHV